MSRVEKSGVKKLWVENFGVEMSSNLEKHIGDSRNIESGIGR